MKKSVAIVLSFVMLLSLVLSGCSSEKDALIGKWSGKLDITDAVNQSIVLDDPTMQEYLKISDFSIQYALSFYEDDTYTMKVDRAAFDNTVQNLIAQVKDGMIAYMEYQIELMEADMTVEEVLAASGISLDEMLEESFPADIFDEMIDVMEMEGNFKVDDGKLLLSESLDTVPDPAVYEYYTLEGDTLTIDEGSEEVDAVAGLQIYPMVLKKVG